MNITKSLENELLTSVDLVKKMGMGCTTHKSLTPFGAIRFRSSEIDCF